MLLLDTKLISEVLDAMPGVINNIETFFSEVSIGQEFYQSHTSSGAPAGYSRYTLISKEMDNYTDEHGMDFSFKGYLTKTSYESIQYQSISDTFNWPTKRIFLTEEDAKNFCVKAEGMYSENLEWRAHVSFEKSLLAMFDNDMWENDEAEYYENQED